MAGQNRMSCIGSAISNYSRSGKNILAGEGVGSAPMLDLAFDQFQMFASDFVQFHMAKSGVF